MHYVFRIFAGTTALAISVSLVEASVVPTTQVKLGSSDRAAIERLTCLKDSGVHLDHADAFVYGSSMSEGDIVYATAYCQPHTEIQGFPVRYATECERLARAWTCGS